MTVDYTIGELVERLINLRDVYKHDLSRKEIDMLADTCNILDKTFSRDTKVGDILFKDYKEEE